MNKAVTPFQTIKGHTSSVRGVAHLPDGQRIITYSSNGSLRLWDLKNGAQIGDYWRDEGNRIGVWTMALSPNGKNLASGSGDGTVRLWDIEMGKVIARWTGHTDFVESVCWSPDGERVVSGSNDGMARVWNVESSEPVLGLNPIKTGHEHVYVVSYSTNGTKIATGGYNESAINIWDAKTGEPLSTIKFDYAPWCLAWTSDEKKLISGTLNGQIRIFDTDVWQQIAVLKGHKEGVRAITLSRNDHLLASASIWDKATRLWNLNTNLAVGPPLNHEHFVNCAAFSADGKLLATACDDTNAYVWDIQAILQGTTLEDLLSLPDAPKDELNHQAATEHISQSSQDIVDKSFLEADATRYLDQLGDTDELPPGFFDNTQDNVHSSTTRGAHPNSSALLAHFSSLIYRARPSNDEATKPTGYSGLHPHALLGRLSSLLHRPRPNNDEANELQQLPGPSESRPDALLHHLSSLFRSPPDIDEVTEFEQHRRRGTSSGHSPHVVEVAAQRDRQTLYVARRREKASDKAKRIKNPKWWVRVVLFLCCVSPAAPDGHCST